jgi:hypothetical protein
VTITTKVVSWNPAHGEVYSIHYGYSPSNRTPVSCARRNIYKALPYIGWTIDYCLAPKLALSFVIFMTRIHWPNNKINHACKKVEMDEDSECHRKKIGSDIFALQPRYIMGTVHPTERLLVAREEIYTKLSLI